MLLKIMGSSQLWFLFIKVCSLYFSLAFPIYKAILLIPFPGAFMFGSAADYEAKYLMDNDVVFISVAYRLGSFGWSFNKLSQRQKTN